MSYPKVKIKHRNKKNKEVKEIEIEVSKLIEIEKDNHGFGEVLDKGTSNIVCIYDAGPEDSVDTLELRNKAIYLDREFNWVIVTNEDKDILLVPSRKR